MKESWENEWCDYYKILGVSFDASEKIIKQEYRKLIKENHPDTYPGLENYYSDKICELNEAHLILSNPSKKKKYDIEYKKRMNIVNNSYTTKSSQTATNNTNNMNYNQYTKEEKQATRRRAVKETFRKEKETAEQNNSKVLNAIENLLIKAYSGLLNNDLYEKNYIVLYDLLNQRINKFMILYSETKQLSMLELTMEIEVIIKNMQEQVSQIPKDLAAAKMFVEKQLKVEEIEKNYTKIVKDVQKLFENFDDLVRNVYENNINNQAQYSDIL